MKIFFKVILFFTLLNISLISYAQSNLPSLNLNESQLLIEKFKITDISIKGTERTDSILIAMYIKVGDTVTPSQIKEDLRRIYGLGYFLDVNATREPYEDGYRLIIQVIENPIINKVELVNNITVFKKEQIEELFYDQLKKTANYNDLNAAKEKVKKMYSDLGYVLADLDFKIDVNGNLSLYVKEGIIEDIRIIGNKVTKNFVIAREITQKAGDLFNINIMRADLRRVFNLNYFENVNLDFTPGEKDPQKVIVLIKVDEKPTSSVNAGGGYNSRDGIVGIFTVSIDNLLGRGQRLGLDLTIGGQSWYGKFEWYDPWFFTGRTSLGCALYKERTPQGLANFIEDRTGFRVSTSKPLFGDPITSPWRGSLYLRSERITAYSLDGKTYLPEVSASKSLDASDNIFGLGLSLSYDSRDVVFDPHSGWMGAILAEPVLGDAKYLKFLTNLNTYIPLTNIFTLALGSRFGIITGITPKYEKYYSGGFNTIRGWREAGYLSGDTMLINSIELRFPIYQIISGAAFLDFGQFWEQGLNMDADYKLDESKYYPYLFRYGFGLGVRVNTPLGALRLDYGFRDINDFSKGELHFSIGQKF